MAVQNDWIVANLNNPSFNHLDMQDILGMDLSNTQILPKESYERSNFIKQHPAFANEDGSFNKEKFERFYDSTLEDWGRFTENEKIDNFEYSLFDTRAKATSKIKDPHFRFETVMNPDRVTTGIAGWNQVGERKWTPSELAQTQKIWDPSTNSFLDETPNDAALTNSPLKFIKSLFEDPIMLATYDEDGEHYDAASGRMVSHKKGQYKLNDEGTYYTEKVNGRSTVGKLVISSLDLITVDGEGANKYDFFDSDSLDKSVTGTIAKNIVSIAPILFGGPIAEVYSGLLIARELAKSLPMLYGMTTALFGNEEDSNILNTISAYGQKFTGGTSQYGQTHTFSFEQIGNMMSDVALQWGQQLLISKAVNKLRGGASALQHADDLAKIEYDKQVAQLTGRIKSGLGTLQELKQYATDLTGKGDWRNSLFGLTALQKYMPAAEAIMKRNARMGADAALAYMAIVSNYDVYNSMLEHGTTKKEAALVAWGSTLGMFSVDKYLGLGEMFFDDLEDLAKNALRRYSREEAGKWAESIGTANNIAIPTIDESKSFITRGLAKAANINAAEADATMLRKGINIGRSIAEEFSNSIGAYKSGVLNHTLNASGKAIGEGLEEVSEELVTDTAKQLYEWAGQLGVDTSTKDVGAWENAFDRYAMSFLGGMAGGAMFYGVGKVQEAKENKKHPQAKDAEKEVIYLLRLHKKQEILDEINSLHKKGKLGSTKLGTLSELDPNTGIRHFLTAAEGEKTLNDIIRDLMIDSVNQLDSYLNEYGANLSEDELFKQMVLGNERLMAIKDKLNNAAYSSNYRQGFLNALEKVINARELLDAAQKEITDTENAQKKAEQAQLAELLKALGIATQAKDTATKALQEAEAELKAFTSGQKSMYYARKTAWLADPIVSSPFTYHTFDQWLDKKKNGLTVEQLSPAEKEKFQNEYLVELNAQKKLEDDEMFDMFLQIEKDFTPYLTLLEQNQDAITSLSDSFKKLQEFRNKVQEIGNRGILSWDDQLPGESKEQFESRNSAIEGETEEQTAQRIQERQNNIIQLNQQYAEKEENIVKYIQEITNLLDLTGSIDPRTHRELKGLISGTNRRTAYSDAISKIVSAPISGSTQRTFSPEYLNYLFKITKDILDTTLTLLENAYSLKKKAAETTANKAVKIQGLFANGSIDLAVELALQSVATSDAIFKGVIDVDSVDVDNDEEVLTVVNQASDPAILLKLIDNAANYLMSTQENLQAFSDSVLNEEIAKSVIANIKDAISGATDYSSLIESLNLSMSEEDLFNVETSVKNNIVDVVKSITDNITSSFKTLQSSHNDEELLTNLSSFKDILTTNVLNTITELGYETSADTVTGETKFNKLFNNNKKFKADIESAVSDFIEKISEKLPKSILQDPYIKFYDTVDEKLTATNPLSAIAKIVADKYGIAEGDIDEVLNKIQERLDNVDNMEDFELLPHQEQALTYLNFVYDVAKAFLHQSSMTPTWLSPMGHAKFWNDFAAKNQKLVGANFHLPQLASGLATQFLTEISLYQHEIKNWQKLHQENAVNKERLFNVAGEKIEEAKVLFYKNNIAAFRQGLSLNDIHLDILDDISDSDTSVDIETRLANNLYNILSQGISLKDYLKKTKLLEKILPADEGLEALINQDTNILDDKLTYNDLTGYQKVQILLSALLHNSSKFEKFNKEHLGEFQELRIAPISIQKQIILAGKGFVNGSYIVSQIYSYLQEELGDKLALPIFDKMMIVEGVGGAGKSKAIVRQIIGDFKDEEVWVSAPVTSQLTNLSLSINKNAKSFDKTQLMSQILENPAEYSKSELAIRKGSGDSNFEKRDYNGGDIFVDTGALKLKATPNAPKILVIDEVTHFSNSDLQLLNRWAKENKVLIIALGDQHQMGSVLGNSISSGYSFTLFRTPKLSVSLRESNIHVQNNNAAIDSLVTRLENFAYELGMTNQEAENKLIEFAKDEFKKLNLTNYYNGDTFHGTVVEKEIPTEIINIIKTAQDKVEDSKKSANIAFVGSTSSSTLKKLKDAGIQISDNNIFSSVGKIQSQEFDYVVFDDQLAITDSEQVAYLGENTLNLARKLYTLNTRAKQGLVIINNDFDTTIGGTVTRQATTAPAKTIASAVNSFILNETNRLANLSFDEEYHDLSEIQPVVAAQTEETTEEDGEDSEKETSEEETATELQNKQDNQRESEQQKLDELQHQDDEQLEKEEKLDSTIDTELTDPAFSMRSIGYFMPILGGYTRTGNKGEEHKYIKLANSKVGSTTILEDLASVTILDTDISTSENSELTTDQLKSSVGKYQTLIRLLITFINNPNHNISKWSSYISIDELTKILNGTSSQTLADGRQAGIYLEAQDYKSGDRFIGMGTASDNAEDMTINGKVYKYVLRFKPTAYNFNGQDVEFAMTLSLAANPSTWLKKQTALEQARAAETDPAKQAALDNEISTLKKNIENYVKYLDLISARPEGVQVKAEKAFTKIRSLGALLRLATLAIYDDKRRPKYERGWLDESGQYKSTSDLFILGSDLDMLGVKASNSGKLAMFVSEFDYNPDELRSIYLDEKESGENCTVRLLILDNAGVNWSSLTNTSYKELYKSKVSTKNGDEMELNFPFKSEAMGYRFLTAMWNWRADLTRFLKVYEDVYGNDADDQVLNIIAANDEIYQKNGNSIPSDLTAFLDILDNYNVTAEDITKLNAFNDENCKDIHTFRLGAASTGKRVQRLNVNAENYFGTSKMPEYVKTSGIYGLAITPQLARTYLEYIQGIFDVFSNDNAGINLSEIQIVHDDSGDRVSSYSNRDRINADRLGSLARHKESGEQRTSGNTLTNLLDNLTSVNKLTIEDGEGNTYNISFLNVGTGRSLSQFMGAVTHLFSIMRYVAYRTAGGESFTPNQNLLKFHLSDGSKVNLNYSTLLSSVLSTTGKYESKAGLVRQQLADPESEEFRFEFGDMFDLMLHGTLLDVSTHALEFDKDTHRVTGGRDDHLKITDAVFKRGMFVDPRAGAVEQAARDGHNLLYKTDLDKRLVMTNTTTELALEFTLPTLGDTQSNVDDTKTYSFDRNLKISGIEDDISSLNPSTVIGNSTWGQLVESIGGTIDSTTGLITIGTKQYEAIVSGKNIQLKEKKPVNAINNLVGKIPVDAIILDQLRNEDIYHSTTIDENGSITIGDYIIKNVETEIDDPLELQLDHDGEFIQVHYNGEHLGAIKLNADSIEFVINSEKANDGASTNEDEEVIAEPTVPKVISKSILDQFKSATDTGEEIEVLNFFKSHADDFNIKDNYLIELNDAITNNNTDYLYDGWIDTLNQELNNQCNG